MGFPFCAPEVIIMGWPEVGAAGSADHMVARSNQGPLSGKVRQIEVMIGAGSLN